MRYLCHPQISPNAKINFRSSSSNIFAFNFPRPPHAILLTPPLQPLAISPNAKMFACSSGGMLIFVAFFAPDLLRRDEVIRFAHEASAHWSRFAKKNLLAFSCPPTHPRWSDCAVERKAQSERGSENVRLSDRIANRGIDSEKRKRHTLN
jgi:hypothetical protein